MGEITQAKSDAPAGPAGDGSPVDGTAPTPPGASENPTTGADGTAGAGGDRRTTRSAALWATVVAFPVTVLVALLALTVFAPDPSTPGLDPNRPQSTEPVAMPAQPLDERAAVVCRALLAHLPATVVDLAQRPVTEGPEQNAAYGDPAVTVACGITPPEFADTDEVWVINHVCWHNATSADAVVLTTVDREVPVRITIPAGYEPPAQWAAQISEAVVSSIRSLPEIPSGCGP
jgi:hypothetical protein